MVMFIFSILYAKGKYQSDLPECVPYNKAYTVPRINKLDSTTYQVFAVAQMWQFQPSEMYIPMGSEVDFYLTSKDVVHGTGAGTASERSLPQRIPDSHFRPI